MALLCPAGEQGFFFATNQSSDRMHQETLKRIVAELEDLLVGRTMGKVFQLSPTSLAIDFHLRQEGVLFISVEPAAPRLYLVKRGLRELERKAVSPSPFAQALQTMGNATVSAITKDDVERIVRFHFAAPADMVEQPVTTMVAQLTGRSANLFLLDAGDTIVHALRKPMGDGQKINETYQTPPQAAAKISREPIIALGGFRSMSEAAAEHYRQIEAESDFKNAAAKLKDQVRREITRREKLRSNLQKDLIDHGDADTHKRLGDLLLANISTAKRAGDRVMLTDYYSEGQSELELTIDENKSLQDAAADAFARYGKAKRAVGEIKARLTLVERELGELKEKQTKLEEAIASRDESILTSIAEGKQKPAARTKGKEPKNIPGTRRYRSSDGYEIIVGRTARDNDNLTFRVARPNDLWLHAGDYPGSHVIVRNANRRELPQRTVIEAAQLAAKFSQAGSDSKVIIHYTPRKFLSKPKGAAPGLVRMSSFKTIAVEPAENIERII
ncbi:MAG TPA: NFACT family protein [Pyrinomonadaceae bacterium]|nr:NFACT family protein [Pyrinomonadaceae bacterium]